MSSGGRLGPRAGWGGAALIVALASAMAGCASTTTAEGLDVARLPVDVRPDYDLFARRCSKCHSLARPLNSGIDDDAHWVDYVARMRRQPGSGISQQDTGPILRFLHYYSLEERRLKNARAATAVSAPPPVSSEGDAAAAKTPSQ